MSTEDVYQEYADFVFKYLLTLTNNDYQSAEEMTQETFYQAIKSIENFHDNGKAKFSTWLCSIAKNVWLQELNREKKRHQLAESLSDEKALYYDLEEDYFRNEDKIHFFKQTHQLSEKKREVIYLRLLGDLSFKEIGSILGESENWARVTFYRAKQLIRKGDKAGES
ncbi:RNA polymerase sigma-70 factor, ECF subfamily [Terribacillus halophilus]|uniref:RNA polymerase sigma-70 factor, ECF subfamily n=1 Tax=Terribacillus halophilus TaxID=361279 RepID=A0A1G6QW39_9BACI|nr:sigma-70 family RNA polymerase sigma factor [Terribacillus halophilus]SDC96481.1 RNA polymerase sigma-70 factor, ECF subfamily [Terribacillus halophilus]